MNQLADDEIVRIIAGAFAPFDCVVQLRRRHQQVRFKVGHKTLWFYVEMGYPLAALRDERALKNMLMTARQELNAKGHYLSPWPRMTTFLLKHIPGELLSEIERALPAPQAAGPALQTVTLSLPDGRRTRVTFVRTLSRRSRTACWVWNPQHAELLKED